MAIPAKVDNMLNQIINAKESKLDSIVGDLNKALLDISEKELKEAHQKVLNSIKENKIEYKFNENLIIGVFASRLKDSSSVKPTNTEKKEKDEEVKKKKEVSSGIESTEELEIKPKSKEEILKMRKEVKEMEEELNAEDGNLKKESKDKKDKEENKNKDDEITYTLDEEESEKDGMEELKSKENKDPKEEILKMREEIKKMTKELDHETGDLKREKEEISEVEDKKSEKGEKESKGEIKEIEKKIKKKRKFLGKLRERLKKKEKEIKDDVKKKPKIEEVKAEETKVEKIVKEEGDQKQENKVEEVKIEPKKEIIKPVEKLEVIASLDVKEIEDVIKNILKAQDIVKGIGRFELTGKGERLEIDFEITVKRGIKINTYITGDLVNTDDNIVFSESDIDADLFKKKIKSMLEKDLGSLGEKIKAYFEMQYGKKIKKMQIKDSKLDIYAVSVEKEPKTELVLDKNPIEIAIKESKIEDAIILEDKPESLEDDADLKRKPKSETTERRELDLNKQKISLSKGEKFSLSTEEFKDGDKIEITTDGKKYLVEKYEGVDKFMIYDLDHSSETSFFMGQEFMSSVHHNAKDFVDIYYDASLIETKDSKLIIKGQSEKWVNIKKVKQEETNQDGEEDMYQIAKDLGLFEDEKDNIEIATKIRKKSYQEKVLLFHKDRWKDLSDKDAEEYKESMLKSWDSALDRLVADKEVIIESVQVGKETSSKKKIKKSDEGFVKKAIKEIEVDDKELLPSWVSKYSDIKTGTMLKVQSQGKINKVKLLTGQNRKVVERDDKNTDNIILELYKMTGTGSLKVLRSQDTKISISEGDYKNKFMGEVAEINDEQGKGGTIKKNHTKSLEKNKLGLPGIKNRIERYEKQLDKLEFKISEGRYLRVTIEGEYKDIGGYDKNKQRVSDEKYGGAVIVNAKKKLPEIKKKIEEIKENLGILKGDLIQNIRKLSDKLGGLKKLKEVLGTYNYDKTGGTANFETDVANWVLQRKKKLSSISEIIKIGLEENKRSNGDIIVQSFETIKKETFYFPAPDEKGFFRDVKKEKIPVSGMEPTAYQIVIASDDLNSATFSPIEDSNVQKELIKDRKELLKSVCNIKGNKDGGVIKLLKPGKLKKERDKRILVEKAEIQIGEVAEDKKIEEKIKQDTSNENKNNNNIIKELIDTPTTKVFYHHDIEPDNSFKVSKASDNESGLSRFIVKQTDDTTLELSIIEKQELIDIMVSKRIRLLEPFFEIIRLKNETKNIINTIVPAKLQKDSTGKYWKLDKKGKLEYYRVKN